MIGQVAHIRLVTKGNGETNREVASRLDRILLLARLLLRIEVAVVAHRMTGTHPARPALSRFGRREYHWLHAYRRQRRRLL